MPAYDPIRDCEPPPSAVSLHSPRSPSKGSLDAILDGGLHSPVGSPAALERSLSAQSLGRPGSATSVEGHTRSPLFASSLPVISPPKPRRTDGEAAEGARRSSSPLRMSMGAANGQPTQAEPDADLAQAVFPSTARLDEALPIASTSKAPAIPSKPATASPTRPAAMPAEDKPMTISAASARKTQAPAAAKPYAPRRITTAHTVLRPLSEAERQELNAQCRNTLRTGPPQPPPDPGEPSAFAISTITNAGSSMFTNGAGSKKRNAHEMMGDVREVADHYNKRQNTGRSERNKSPIIGLRNFNNWVKSVLIDRYARRPAIPQGQYRPPIKVLDMGCGKGGDLRKWVIAGVDQYIGLDLADVSVEQAAGRWRELPNSKRFPAHFAAMDCFVDSIANHLDPQLLDRPFDTVSMQFCMHYAFQSLAKARVMLENVTRYLRPGGIFLGTIPNSMVLLSELMSLPEDSESWSFGNSVYKVTFDERGEELPVYGQRYSFFLQDAVDDVPEYVVHWDHFVELAAEYGLELVFHQTFHDLFEDANGEDEYKAMLVRMGVVNEEGESELTEEQWEIANLYVAFAFQMSDPADVAA